jgi:hypothetical protein
MLRDRSRAQPRRPKIREYALVNSAAVARQTSNPARPSLLTPMMSQIATNAPTTQVLTLGFEVNDFLGVGLAKTTGRSGFGTGR